MENKTSHPKRVQYIQQECKCRQQQSNKPNLTHGWGERRVGQRCNAKKSQTVRKNLKWPFWATHESKGTPCISFVDDIIILILIKMKSHVTIYEKGSGYNISIRNLNIKCHFQWRRCILT